MGLDVVEAVDKLTIRLLKGIIRIELVETRSINHTEQEIAKFLSRAFLIFFVQLHLELTQFLAHLFPDILTILPVEAHIAGFILYAIGLNQ